MKTEKIRFIHSLDLGSERKGGIKMTPSVLDWPMVETFTEVEKGSW